MPARFQPLGPGDPAEIAGYALRARLGAGGMGTVYLSHTRGGLPVALKLVRREFAEDAEFRRRFKREVETARLVQGPYTAPVLDADTDSPTPWLAAAYVAGPSLVAAVAEHGLFPLPSVLRLLAGAAQGVASVHAAGLIHRDLKPANLLLAADGPRVIDFGIAHAADSSTLTSTGQVLGTPAYMSPEQIRGRPVEATDVWALGQLALWAATGRSAFGDGNQAALVHRILNEPPDLDDCDPALRPVIEWCLAKDPSARPRVADVVAAANDALRRQAGAVVTGSWLPPAVAASLADYAPPPAPAPAAGFPGPAAGQAAPPSQPYPAPAGPAWSHAPTQTAAAWQSATQMAAAGASGPSAAPPPMHAAAPPPGPPAATLAGPTGAPPGGSPKRQLSRPILFTSLAAAAIVIVALVAYAIGSSSASSTKSSGQGGPTGAAAPGSTAGAANGSGSGNGSPAATGAPPAYPLKYTDAFNMPGESCSDGATPSWVDFTGDGPNVQTDNSGNDYPNQFDLELDCEAMTNGDPGITFGQQYAQVSGTPSPAGCETALSRSPGDGSIAFDTLSKGEEFCLDTGSGLLVLLTLNDLDENTFNMSWTATAWTVPKSN